MYWFGFCFFFLYEHSKSNKQKYKKEGNVVGRLNICCYSFIFSLLLFLLLTMKKNKNCKNNKNNTIMMISKKHCYCWLFFISFYVLRVCIYRIFICSGITAKYFSYSVCQTASQSFSHSKEQKKTKRKQSRHVRSNIPSFLYIRFLTIIQAPSACHLCLYNTYSIHVRALPVCWIFFSSYFAWVCLY